MREWIQEDYFHLNLTTQRFWTFLLAIWIFENIDETLFLVPNFIQSPCIDIRKCVHMTQYKLILSKYRGEQWFISDVFKESHSCLSLYCIFVAHAFVITEGISFKTKRWRDVNVTSTSVVYSIFQNHQTLRFETVSFKSQNVTSTFGKADPSILYF